MISAAFEFARLLAGQASEDVGLRQESGAEQERFVYLYTDRPIYRPGDTVFFKGIVRDTDYGRLTPREQEIMRMLAEGLPKSEIADRLCISIKTVDNHRSNIMKKLDLHSAMDLVRYAAKLGLIDIDLWKE